MSDLTKELSVSASEVRKHWSETIGTAVRAKPVFISRTGDKLILMKSDAVKDLVNPYKFHVQIFKEKDGSYTGSVDEIDVVENGSDREECIGKVIASMREYSLDYYTEFALWNSDPKRKKHIPYIMKCLINDDEALKESLVCRT